jgi:hypothetical protein
MHDSDESQRLENLQKLYKDGMLLMIRARDEAAYDLRTKYSSEDAQFFLELIESILTTGLTVTMKRNGLTPLRKEKESIFPTLSI